MTMDYQSPPYWLKPGTLILVTRTWDHLAQKGDVMMVLEHRENTLTQSGRLECLVPRLTRPKFLNDHYFNSHFEIVDLSKSKKKKSTRKCTST